MQGEWLADVTNDPRRDFDLCIEISKANEHWGTIAREENGELVLQVFASQKPAQVPARWLAEVLLAAERELPVKDE